MKDCVGRGTSWGVCHNVFQQSLIHLGSIISNKEEDYSFTENGRKENGITEEVSNDVKNEVAGKELSQTKDINNGLKVNGKHKI